MKMRIENYCPACSIEEYNQWEQVETIFPEMWSGFSTVFSVGIRQQNLQGQQMPSGFSYIKKKKSGVFFCLLRLLQTLLTTLHRCLQRSCVPKTVYVYMGTCLRNMFAGRLPLEMLAKGIPCLSRAKLSVANADFLLPVWLFGKVFLVFVFKCSGKKHVLFFWSKDWKS